MNPWEILVIALAWLAVIAIVLIAALIVLAIAISTYHEARKALKRARQ